MPYFNLTSPNKHNRSFSELIAVVEKPTETVLSVSNLSIRKMIKVL